MTSIKNVELRRLCGKIYLGIKLKVWNVKFKNTTFIKGKNEFNTSLGLSILHILHTDILVTDNLRIIVYTFLL